MCRRVEELKRVVYRKELTPVGAAIVLTAKAATRSARTEARILKLGRRKLVGFIVER